MKKIIAILIAALILVPVYAYGDDKTFSLQNDSLKITAPEGWEFSDDVYDEFHEEVIGYGGGYVLYNALSGVKENVILNLAYIYNENFEGTAEELVRIKLKEIEEKERIAEESKGENSLLRNKVTEEEIKDFPQKENILYQKIPDVSAWGKLYKRTILDHIEYPEGKIYEDTARIAEIVFRAGKIAFTHEPLYDYIIAPYTLSHGKYSPSKLEYIEAVDHMTQLIESKYPEMKKACVCRRVFAALSVRRYFAYETATYVETKSKLESFIRSKATTVVFNRHTPFRNKIGVLSLLIGSNCYDRLWKVYDKGR